MVIIIFSVYITNQTLKEISPEEKKPQVQNIPPLQTELPPVAPSPERPPETKKPEEKPKEAEFNLDQIPENQIRDIQDQEEKEALSSGEKKLNKQPTLEKLKELKTKGVIIY